MTRAERALAQRWRHVLLVCVLVALAGVVVLLWSRQQHAADERGRISEVAQEANLRGKAVATLAGDVRQLRTQIQSEGKTPSAPDPAKAVEDLQQRAEVPVPIPGPRGPKGEPGKPAPTITPRPGPSGPSGPPGEPAPTITPQPGEPGEDGQDGKDGTDGRDGQPPVGWTFTFDGRQYTCRRADDFDPQAPRYECGSGQAQEPTQDPSTPPASPSPSPSGGSGLLGLALALDPYRRTYL